MALLDVSALPPDKQALLDAVTDRLRTLRGVDAVVLGGSWACGTARSNSDLDIGLYYDPARPFSIADVRVIAQDFSETGSSAVVSELYGWGPWVNGGAWIYTPAGKLDFLYRNLTQVQQVIDEANSGAWRHDYDQQPPYGFRSLIYLAETRVCVPLYDPNKAIAALKNSVAVYPAALKQRVVQECLWGSEFTFAAARASIERGDVYCVAGCATRVAQFLVQALFALNEQYCISDKNAGRLIGGMELCPPDYEARLSAVLKRVGGTVAEMQQSLDSLEQIWRDVAGLAKGLYQPRYTLRRT